jgi:hypothetical protein
VQDRTLRVIHIRFCFHPDTVGGTKLYVEVLARERGCQGIQNISQHPELRGHAK